MKIFITFFILFLCTTIGVVAQTNPSSHQTQKDSVLNRVDSLVQITNAWLEQIELDFSLKQRYKLYQTENIYTLLQLDSKTGMIEQVQWSLDSENEGSVTINDDDLNFGFGMVQVVLSYIPQRICTSSFYLIKQMEENGMFNGE